MELISASSLVLVVAHTPPRKVLGEHVECVHDQAQKSDAEFVHVLLLLLLCCVLRCVELGLVALCVGLCGSVSFPSRSSLFFLSFFR